MLSPKQKSTSAGSGEMQAAGGLNSTRASRNPNPNSGLELGTKGQNGPRSITEKAERKVNGHQNGTSEHEWAPHEGKGVQNNIS